MKHSGKRKRTPARNTIPDAREQAMIRLNKFLSLCGVTSRRGAEILMAEERVTINGEIVTKVGTIIDETKDVITVDGAVVKPVQKKVYVAMNKPRMVMTTLSDPFRRKTILHLLKGVSERVYPIGRLDYDSEGILLLTNDGEMAYRLAHPRYGVRKVYEVRVSGEFGPAQAKRIQQGIQLEDGAIGKAQQVTILSATDGETKVRLTLTEGRKREVKQLCKAVGTPVKHLKRIEFAGITQRDLAPGKWRYLTPVEIEFLIRKVGLDKENHQESAPKEG